MTNPIRVLSLSAALLIGPALPAGATHPPAATTLPDRLGELLLELEQDQALRLTRSAGDREAQFSAAPPEQVLQTLSGPGQTAIVLLGAREARGNAPLSLQRALRVSKDGSGDRPDDRLPAARPQLRSAYVLNQPAEADLSLLLTQLLANGRPGAISSSMPLETVSATDAMKAVNGWKGVRFIAGFEASPGTSEPVLRQLVLVPDTIRISVSGDGVARTALAPRSKASPPTTPQAAAISVSDTMATEARGSSSRAHREPAQVEAERQQHLEQMEQERALQEQADQETMRQEQAQWEQLERQRVENEQIEREQIEQDEMARERAEHS